MKSFSKCALILAFLVVVATPLAAQQLIDTGTSDRPSHRGDRGIIPPDRHSATVSSIYDRLGSLGLRARKDLYATLSDDVKRDLWSMHLNRWVATMPVLSDEQDGVIADTRALISFGYFENTAPGAEGRDRWLAASAVLAQRGRLAFSREAFRLLFFELGGPAAGLLDYAPERDTCNCSTVEDFCDTITNPDPNCVTGPMLCTRTAAGCGWFWQEACNGLCAA